MSKGILGGKYVLDRRLGGGGMAEVFLASAVGADGFARPVAIKRVLPGYSSDPRFAQMFVTEAQLSSRLQHPNVVSVLDFDRDHDGQMFLVMELVDGPSIDELVSTGLVPVAAAAYLAGEILRGLGYAHELPIVQDGVRGVIHRDLSPHNVLMSWEGAVKVSDFGIAKARAATSATASELVKGKPAYMSPEQANGESLDGRSDLFAIGIVLWELLCGRTLFSGATTSETFARLLFAPIPSPRELRPDVPADLARVVMRLLERARDARYPTAAAALTALVECDVYPRGGRELLVALLAERFADRAPRRSGLHGDLSTVIPLASANRDLPRPLDAIRAAPTVAQRRSHVVPIALVAAALGAGAVGIWSTTREPAAPVTPRMALASPPDAAVAPPPDAGVAIADAPAADAAVADAPKLKRRPRVDDLAVPKPHTFETMPPPHPDPVQLIAAGKRLHQLGRKYCPTWYTDLNVGGYYEFSSAGIVTLVRDITPVELAPCITKILRATRFPPSMYGGRMQGVGFGGTPRP